MSGALEGAHTWASLSPLSHMYLMTMLGCAGGTSTAYNQRAMTDSLSSSISHGTLSPSWSPPSCASSPSRWCTPSALGMLPPCLHRLVADALLDLVVEVAEEVDPADCRPG